MKRCIIAGRNGEHGKMLKKCTEGVRVNVILVIVYS